MPVTVKTVTIWRKEVPNQPGLLAETLGPLVQAGANLGVLMGYRLPGEECKAAIELYPITGAKAAKAAAAAGLVKSHIPALHVMGDDKPGLMHRMAQSLAAAGINISFLMAQVVGRKYTAIWGFESPEAARKAAGLIKKTK
ncbi:MAG: hypothetical protein IT159_06830 [Bryobacterales bacterium]|jgi:hypothetical protein|nr:hypothetical protein [Bryobacterales bacterium]